VSFLVPYQFPLMNPGLEAEFEYSKMLNCQRMVKTSHFEGRIAFASANEAEVRGRSCLLAKHYERCSVMITSNPVFPKWDQIFKDPMMTIVAIDRLVHHATIPEFGGENVRAKKAKARSST